MIWIGIRARLLLLILLALLPALGLALYTGWRHHRASAVQAQQEALRLAQIAARDHEQLIRRARQLLHVLSMLPSVRTPNARACGAFFADLLKEYPQYANFGVVDAAGDVVCSGLPVSGPTNLTDRSYIRRAIETRDFAVGDYQIGRITGKATINFGYPLFDRTGQAQAVVFAALDLARLSQLVAARLPSGALFTVIDRNGTILVRHPDPEQLTGKPVSGTPLGTIVLAAHESTVEMPDLSGVPRLFGFTSVRDAGGEPDLYVWVGIPSATAFAEADRLLASSLITLGLVGLLALAAAWICGDRSILGPVRALAQGTERLKAGDLTARIEVTGRDELSTLAARFNEMADRLQVSYDHLAAKAKELEHHLQELNLLREIDLMILAETPLQDLLAKAVEAFARLAGSKTCVLVTADPESGELTPVATFGPDLEAIRQYFATLKPRVGEEGGALGKAIARRKFVMIPDIPSSPEMELYRNICEKLGIRATLAVPLVTGHRMLGAVGIGYPTARSVSEAEIQTITRFASQCAVAWEQTRLQEEAKERRRLEEALRDSDMRKHAIEEASRHKTEFLNNMSHELRTPLNSIIGFAELLRDAGFGSLTERQARFAQNIQTSGEHLLRLINDLLDLSKVEAGKIEFRPEPFGLQEALQAVMIEMQPQADQKSLEVQLVTDEAPSTIIADPVLFKQILSNLLSNAVKFTPEGGRITVNARRVPSVQCSVSSEEPNSQHPTLTTVAYSDCVEIAVADTGIGMQPEDLPKLFREFIRLDTATTRHIAGTGLGLALTKRLVELHGGQIFAVSDGEGCGSTFTVRLPLTPNP